MSTKIILKSADDVYFEIDAEAACGSGVFENMIFCCGTENQPPVTLSNIESDTLGKVVEWLEYENEHPMFGPEFDQWKNNFFNIDADLLIDIVNAANFLDATELYENSCKTVAGILSSKKSEEIRSYFNLEDDLTQAEKDQIRREGNLGEDDD